jgi:hypothetical protein
MSLCTVTQWTQPIRVWTAASDPAREWTVSESVGDKQQNVFAFDMTAEGERPAQEYYDAIKERFAGERDRRLDYRPPGTEIYQEMAGDLAEYETDPYADEWAPREPLVDEVEVLCIGGGFYWNRYPGIACDVVAYDYLPLLDETGYVPSRHYVLGQEIWDYCKSIAEKYDLYQHAVFQTTVTPTVWNEAEQLWSVGTDRGDEVRARRIDGPLLIEEQQCKRPCFHNDCLPTFNRPNVHLVDTHGKGSLRLARRARCSTARCSRSTSSSTRPVSRCRRPASTTASWPTCATTSPTTSSSQPAEIVATRHPGTKDIA